MIIDRSATILFLLRRVDCNDGVASYCETIIRGLTSRGDKVIIISGPVTEMYGSSVRRKAIEALVAGWYVFDKFPSRPNDLGVVRKMLGLIKSHAVDVISPQGLAVLPLAAILSNFSGKRVVGNYHPSMTGSSAAQISTSIPITSRLLALLLMQLTRPNKMIAMSKANEAFFLDVCRLKKENINYIPIGIDTQDFFATTNELKSEGRSEFDLEPDALICVLSGRLNFVKGHDLLVDAIRLLRTESPGKKIVCLFAGGGDQEMEIRDYAHKNSLDEKQFQFRGFFNKDMISKIYRFSDVIVLPSRFEGYGLTIAEAMACGCVPIRTPGGGWQDQIIDGENGFIVPFNDSAALAARILELTDREKLSSMREKAISYAHKNFSLDRMVEATSNLFRSVAH